MTAPRHFLSIADIPPAVLRAMVDRARALKAARAGWPKGRPDADRPLDGRLVALIFEKASTRTRASFEAAARQLGGSAMVFAAAEMQLGRGESVADTARVLARYVDAIMIRARRHDQLLALAKAASVPVLNGLTDLGHPCQLMADVLTFEERRGPIEGRTIAWLGDANNVANSLIETAAAFGFRLRLGCPAAYRPSEERMAAAHAAGGEVLWTEDPAQAAAGADAVMTDTWVSMGQEGEAEKRLKELSPYRVSQRVMALAAPGALFLHCLPAHRGEEVDAEVIDGPASAVWDQAENRLHAQKAILRWCLKVD
ncbi:MAG: ornithine carbamoyltransferase [Pseudomonadota bacterium]